jgi:hypothetical protein
MRQARFSSYRVYVEEKVQKPQWKRRWYCYIDVEDTGYVQITEWEYRGEKSRRGGWRFSNEADKKNYDAYRVLLSILDEEMELIKLQPIGPEDSEYFATDELWEVIQSGDRFKHSIRAD